MGIGFGFFLHKYYRTQKFRKSMRLGCAMMSVSFIFIWGNLELQPFITSWFYSKFIEKLASQDLHSDIYYKYLEKESIGIDFTNSITGLNTNANINGKFEVEKMIYNYENEVLSKLGFEKKNTVKIKNFTVGNLRNECGIDVIDFFNKEMKNTKYDNLTTTQIIKKNILINDILRLNRKKRSKTNSLLKVAFDDSCKFVHSGISLDDDKDYIKLT